ncbi:membrane-associating domain-containing protein [Xylariaceae sp. FL0255]|nr:membrane-associating domain-containing protein [Xylariaceae sp. FL0255]
MMALNPILLGLRIAQFTLAFLVIILSGYVANWFAVSAMTNPPAQVDWFLIASVFSLFTLGYIEGTSRLAPRFFNSYAAFALEALNSLFYFAGFIALSLFLRSLFRCRAGPCSAARADVAFGAFEFVLWAATAVLTGLEVFRNSPGTTRLSKMQLRRLAEKEAQASAA